MKHRFLLLLLLTMPATLEAASIDAATLSQTTHNGSAEVVVGLRRGVDALPAASAMERTMPADIAVRHCYESVAGFSARLTAPGLAALADHPDVQWIAADIGGGGALEESVPRIGADRVHRRFVTGGDVVVAVLDSGVEASHPDIAGAVIHEECFCSGSCPGLLCEPACCPDGGARASGPGSAAPGHPHGTNITGILLSRGNVAGTGVAPATQVVAVRVLDAANSGLVSDWLAALDWIAVHRRDVRIVNMSLASFRVFSGDCVAKCEEECRAEDGCDADAACGLNRMIGDVVATLRRRGTIVVAAAGNQLRSNRISTPACVPGVLAVGATNRDDSVADFSNAGVELDLLAPGVDVISSGVDGELSLLCSDIGGERICGGTSMAAPHVSGTAALLASARPSASAEQIEAAMIETGVPIVDERSGRTYPRIDALAAFRALTRVRQIEPAGGSGQSDCLLGWNFIPPDIVRRSATPVAACSDGAFCDADDTTGQCTFLLSLCFNVRDPLLPFCATGEAIASVQLPAAKSVIEKANADAIRAALPPTPLRGADLCTRPIPLSVPVERVTSVRLQTRTATRTDEDAFVLRCTVR